MSRAAEARDKRNIDPTPEAYIAMSMWGQRYSAQRGGSMDFWDSLTGGEQRLCNDVLAKVLEAHKRHSKR